MNNVHNSLTLMMKMNFILLLEITSTVMSKDNFKFVILFNLLKKVMVTILKMISIKMKPFIKETLLMSSDAKIQDNFM